MAEANEKIGPGPLVLVVGPSGAGKDTLLAGVRELLCEDTKIDFPRRLITRSPDPEVEDHDTLDEQMFVAKREAGAFALCWTAHDLSYAISADIDARLKAGMCVVCNVSRSVIADALEKYHVVRVIAIAAPEQVLAERLAARGRETRREIAGRLKRAQWSVPPGTDYTLLDNTGTVKAGTAALAEQIRDALK